MILGCGTCLRNDGLEDHQVLSIQYLWILSNWLRGGLRWTKYSCRLLPPLRFLRFSLFYSRKAYVLSWNTKRMELLFHPMGLCCIHLLYSSHLLLFWTLLLRIRIFHGPIFDQGSAGIVCFWHGQVSGRWEGWLCQFWLRSRGSSSGSTASLLLAWISFASRRLGWRRCGSVLYGPFCLPLPIKLDPRCGSARCNSQDSRLLKQRMLRLSNPESSRQIHSLWRLD